MLLKCTWTVILQKKCAATGRGCSDSDLLFSVAQAGRCCRQTCSLSLSSSCSPHGEKHCASCEDTVLVLDTCSCRSVCGGSSRLGDLVSGFWEKKNYDTYMRLQQWVHLKVIIRLLDEITGLPWVLTCDSFTGLFRTFCKDMPDGRCISATAWLI